MGLRTAQTLLLWVLPPVLDVGVTLLSRENRKGGSEGLAIPVSQQHCHALLANRYFQLSQARQPRSGECCPS